MLGALEKILPGSVLIITVIFSFQHPRAGTYGGQGNQISEPPEVGGRSSCKAAIPARQMPFMRHIPEDGAAQNSLSWEASLKESIPCLGGNGTGFLPASLNLTHTLSHMRTSDKTHKGQNMSSGPHSFHLCRLYSVPHTTHTLTDCSSHLARSNHPRSGSISYDHGNKHLSNLKLYLALERDMLRTQRNNRFNQAFKM